MIFLTGGAGFIGSCFLWKLNSEGIEDIVVIDELDETEKWKNLRGKKFLDYIQKNDFIEMVREHKVPTPEAVIHMGACSSTTGTDGDHYIKNNYEYSKVLAEWSLANQAYFLYASSAATYGDGALGYSDDEARLHELRPLNMYGYSKCLFDLWARASGVLKEITGLKFFNVFGPNEYHKGEMKSVICKAFPALKSEGKIKLFRSYKDEFGDGEQKRDFVYIKDVVDVMYGLFNSREIKGIYNLGTGEARSWNDLAHAMFAALGKPADIEYIDMPPHLRGKYQYFTQADMRKLKQAGIDHEFRSLEQAVKDYTSYLLEGSYL
jgi:ADP-L-glycero-D-manno-heptose 6-epimerase